jgi:hypothetical protein
MTPSPALDILPLVQDQNYTFNEVGKNAFKVFPNAILIMNTTNYKWKIFPSHTQEELTVNQLCESEFEPLVSFTKRINRNDSVFITGYSALRTFPEANATKSDWTYLKTTQQHLVFTSYFITSLQFPLFTDDHNKTNFRKIYRKDSKEGKTLTSLNLFDSHPHILDLFTFQNALSSHQQVKFLKKSNPLLRKVLELGNTLEQPYTLHNPAFVVQ